MAVRSAMRAAAAAATAAAAARCGGGAALAAAAVRGGARTECASCGARIQRAPYCNAAAGGCDVPQPAAEAAEEMARRDPFALLGLDRKFDVDDPFALLGLDRTFDIDEKELEAAYRGLQRELHPDKFAASGGDRVVAAAEEASRAVNLAVGALRDPLKRAEALLGLIGGDETGSNATSPALLMEVMELDEEAEAAASKGVDALTDMHDRLNGRVSTEVSALSAAFAGEDVRAAAEATTRLKFMRRIMRDVRDKMPH